MKIIRIFDFEVFTIASTYLEEWTCVQVNQSDGTELLNVSRVTHAQYKWTRVTPSQHHLYFIDQINKDVINNNHI